MKVRAELKKTKQNKITLVSDQPTYLLGYKSESDTYLIHTGTSQRF